MLKNKFNIWILLIFALSSSLAGAGSFSTGVIDTTARANAATAQATANAAVPAASFGTYLTNSAEVTGLPGEYLEAGEGLGGTALTSDNAISLRTLPLSPGVWDVSATAYFLPSTTTSVTEYIVCLQGTTPAGCTDGMGDLEYNITISSGQLAQRMQPATVTPIALVDSFSIPPVRVIVTSATTNIYMTVMSVFTVSTNVVYGIIRARRIK